MRTLKYTTYILIKFDILRRPTKRYKRVILSFYRASYARAVLGVVILFVRPSVRPSHACFVTNPKNLTATFLYYMKGQSF